MYRKGLLKTRVFFSYNNCRLWLKLEEMIRKQRGKKEQKKEKNI